MFQAMSLRPLIYRRPSSLFSSAMLVTRPHRNRIQFFLFITSCTQSVTPSASDPSTKLSRKLRRDLPENVLRHRLDLCSKNTDISEALRLYDFARDESIPLSLHHYNILLYLCSHSSAAPSHSDRAIEIFHQMSIDGIEPNEATFTALVRLTTGRGDPDHAFELIKRMSATGITPRLRSYGPALFGFCEKGDVEKAHELEAHMLKSEVSAEEPELSALFRLNSGLGRGGDVYRLLHRMRSDLRKVTEGTAKAIEDWFLSEAAAGFGVEKWDAEMVKEGMLKGGGGWHGRGWLGKGQWLVGRIEMNKDGVCWRCGERMACIDINPVETEAFAKALAELACKKEARSDFAEFQNLMKWMGSRDGSVLVTLF